MLIFVNHDDLRSLEVMEELLRKGYYVSDQLSDMRYADVIYMGSKGIDRKHRLLMNNETKFVSEDILKDLKKNCLILTLIDNEYLSELSKKYDFQYLCLLKEEEFVRKNSLLTAEGLISYLISHRRFPIYQSHIMILGYGNCAKPIIDDLKALGATVTVVIRNEQYRKEIEQKKCLCQLLPEVDLSKQDIIINTIPSVIIDEKKIDCIDKQTMIVDIASYPYGIDHHYALSKGYNCQILPAIPCKYAYGYAGKMIVDVIERECSHA